MDPNSGGRDLAWANALGPDYVFCSCPKKKKAMRNAFAKANGYQSKGDISTMELQQFAGYYQMMNPGDQKEVRECLDTVMDVLEIQNKYSPQQTANFSIPKPAPQTKGNNMYVDHDVTERKIEDRRLDHFLDRIYSVRDEKHTEIAKKFHKYDDDAPESPEEFVKRIKEGKFRIRKHEPDECMARAYPHKLIQWRTEDFDEDGYAKAQEKLADGVVKTRDAMWAEPAEAHKALAAFQKEKFH